MPFGTLIDNSILDHFVRKTTWAAVADFYIGLSSTTPGKDATGITEPTTGGYARLQVTAAQFDAAASSANTTNTEKAWVQATADYLAAANLTNLVIFNHITNTAAADYLGFKAFTVAKAVLSGDTAKIASGDLDISIGGT